jgi:hypothetical protein
VSQSTDVFRSLNPDECQALFRELKEAALPLYRQAEQTAASTLRVRPVFLRRQPFAKRCEMMRKSLALKMNLEAATDILATFFMSSHEELVAELLDALELEHDGGVLTQRTPQQPPAERLQEVVAEFRRGEDPLLREILLKTFAGQAAIAWPLLDELVFPPAAVAEGA